MASAKNKIYFLKRYVLKKLKPLIIFPNEGKENSGRKGREIKTANVSKTLRGIKMRAIQEK